MSSHNQTALVDAERTNLSSRSVKVYKDLDLFFTMHPIKKDIVALKYIEAVKRSVKNLIFTNHYERPFHPEIGSGIRGMLFELVSSGISGILQRQIKDVINNFEPRVELTRVDVIPNEDQNRYEVELEFYILNMPAELVTLNVLLERTR